MNKYMKDLKIKMLALCEANECKVENMRVRCNVLTVCLEKESQISKMYKQYRVIIDMIDADGAGDCSSFDGLTDTWSKREGYNNTQGIEARVAFSTNNWGI